MKKVLILALAVLLTAGMASIALANGNGNGIAGSPHDFSDDAWNLSGEICRVCHVPHDHARVSQNYLNGLLWNRGLSTATYSMYDAAWSSTLQGAQSADPDGIAKLCLGCHDGTIAIDTFDKYATAAVFVASYDPAFEIPGFANGADLDLRGTHPISITYDNAQDPGLAPTTTIINGLTTIGDVLDFGKVQCSSCHDVHDSINEAVAGTHLLRKAQTVAQGGTASGLCLTCHLK